MQSTALPDTDHKPRYVRSLFDRIAPRYEAMNHILSLGMAGRWRRRACNELRLPPTSLVADLASGTGDMARILCANDYRVIAVDFSAEMLRCARGVPYRLHADICELPFRDHSLDGATCGFGLRNVDSIDRFFAELARVVRPGGRVALLDATAPTNKVLRAGHRLLFGELVTRIGRRFVEHDAYAYLPASLDYLPPNPQIAAKLGRVGFSDVATKTFLGGSAALLSATRND